MGKKKKPLIAMKKPSSIVCIVAFCGGCEKNVSVDATFEVDVQDSYFSHPDHPPGEYCYCEFPSAEIRNKRLEFTCPSCKYFSTVYIT